jgi:3-deoxy-7-phosphoheptulonate synthase
MPIVVEIMSQTQLEVMLKYVDVFQIGARNMQNFNLLRALGETRKTILLKRGLSATIEELLMSAEYILAGGNKQIILCERGIRTFETATRNTTDINAIPVLKQLTHLPVILDPSHATGYADYVPAIARAGIAAGADGLIVEVHPEPSKAASDGKQSLKPEKFAEMVTQIKAIAEVIGRRVAPIKKPVTVGW